MLSSWCTRLQVLTAAELDLGNLLTVGVKREKNFRVNFLLKPGNDSTLSSSYRPIRLLHTVRKLFEIILLYRLMAEFNSRGLLRDEEFVSIPLSMSQRSFERKVAHYAVLGFLYRLKRKSSLQANHPKIPVLPGEINHLLTIILHSCCLLKPPHLPVASYGMESHRGQP